MYLRNIYIMEISIIKIGNSKGFRLPKAILEKYNISDKIELIFEKEQIILKPISEPMLIQLRDQMPMFKNEIVV